MLLWGWIAIVLASCNASPSPLPNPVTDADPGQADHEGHEGHGDQGHAGVDRDQDEPSVVPGLFAVYKKDRWAGFFGVSNVVGGGKVELNRKRAKPSREVRLGDHLVITREHERYEIKVTGLSARRGPASVAATLYEESESSIERRRAQLEQRALERRAAPTAPDRRPDKRSRRRIIRFTRKGEN